MTAAPETPGHVVPRVEDSTPTIPSSAGGTTSMAVVELRAEHTNSSALALRDHGLHSRSRSPANAFRHRDQDGISDLVRRIRHDAMRRQLHLVRSHMQCVNNAVKAIDMLLRAEASTLPQQDLSVHMHGNMPSDTIPYTSRAGQERVTHVHMEPWSPTLLEELDSDSDLTQSR